MTSMARLQWGVMLAAVLAAAVGVLALHSGGDWPARCEQAGGTVEERYEGMVTILDGNPPVSTLVPDYSFHCWVDGQEVEP